MPSKLHGQELITVNQDLVAIGGSDYYGYLQSSKIHHLTCQNKDCLWQTLIKELMIGRMQFVAILIPDDSVDCAVSYTHLTLPTIYSV